MACPLTSDGVRAGRNRTWRRGAALAAAACTLAVAVRSEAQAVPSLDLRGFTPSGDPASGLYLEPARSPDWPEWNTALWLGYAHRPVTLRDPVQGGEVVFDVLGHQLTGDFVLNIGLFERGMIGFDLPFSIYQTGDTPTDQVVGTLGAVAVPAQAFGDLKLLGKFTIVPPTNAEFGGFALALHERFAIPTGDESSFLGEGAISSETRLLVEYRYVAVAVHGALGFKARASQERFGCAGLPPAADGQPADCPTTFGHEIPFGLGLSFVPQAIGLVPGMTWFVETFGYLPAGPEAPFTSEALSQVQVGAGVRQAFGDVSFLLAGEAALLGGIGNPPFRATFSVGWAPRNHDKDDDGIADDDDDCPDLKEDIDGFQDDDGCPDWDNDNDGVPDGEDRCEGQQEDEDGYQDDDGCPDPDNDGDDIVDEQDACPDVPGRPNADPKLHGCTDPDPDKDGITGDADRCPELAEDPDNFQDDDGCPEPDNDGDGIEDENDACPDDAGAPFEGDEEQHGCPDSDGDSVADKVDRCPQDAGVPTDDPETNGCPEPPKLRGDTPHPGPARRR